MRWYSSTVEFVVYVHVGACLKVCLLKWKAATLGDGGRPSFVYGLAKIRFPRPVETLPFWSLITSTAPI